MDIPRYMVIRTVLDIIPGYCMFWLCEALQCFLNLVPFLVFTLVVAALVNPKSV